MGSIILVLAILLTAAYAVVTRRGSNG